MGTGIIAGQIVVLIDKPTRLSLRSCRYSLSAEFLLDNLSCGVKIIVNKKVLWIEISVHEQKRGGVQEGDVVLLFGHGTINQAIDGVERREVNNKDTRANRAKTLS